MSYSLYDRRLMILILKRQGRRSFTEGCRLLKIKNNNSNRNRYEPFISFKQNTKKEESSEVESPESTTPTSDKSFEPRL